MSYDALKSYKQNSIMSASPEELTLMLYDGAIKFMNIAKLNLHDKSAIEKCHVALVRAEDIITELDNSLNMDYEISHEYRQLYDFINTKLVEANIEKNMEPLNDAILITTQLRDTWKEAMRLAKSQSSTLK